MPATIDAIIEQLDPALVSWYFTLSPSEQNLLLTEAAEHAEGLAVPLEAPPDWRDWLPALFPRLFYQPFVDRHAAFWGHIESILPGVKPPAFFAIWGRGGGKTTQAEAAAVRLGAKGVRKFCLYTRSTQDKANESVQNIGAMLESPTVAGFYPALAERKLGKYGNSKGWRVDTLRCANGFNVVALGLDAAVRGIKIEEYRPDVIIIDDVDDKDDTHEAIKKKIDTLTRDILPAGSNDCAVIGIQNLVNYGGIFTQLAQGKADFLHDRIVSGPYPAVEGLEYERGDDGLYHITAGVATWPGQDLVTCESQMNEWGLGAFLSEAQNRIVKKEGRVYHGYSGPGPKSSSLPLDKAEGFYHSHDFGAVNHVWGLWARIDGKYYLVHEEKLPEGTTAERAKRIKARFTGHKIIGGWGGAKGEKQQRLDFIQAGLEIRLPATTDVEGQIDLANRMLESGEMVICADMAATIDHLENCVRDNKEAIQDKSQFHFCDQLRYFAAGIKRQGWSR